VFEAVRESTHAASISYVGNMRKARIAASK
jgi:hypothetical protein